MWRPKRNFANYDAAATRAILELVERQLAAVWLEVEARLAEGPYTDPSTGEHFPLGINPHHLTNGRRALVNQGLVIEVEAATHGGRRISTLVPGNLHRRKTAIERAAARKRLLHTRYLSWADPPTGKPNLIGPAGERVSHESLRSASETLDPTAGRYLLPASRSGNVSMLFGQPVPVGPLDDVAYLTILDRQQAPVLITLAIEVKNVRHWLYPRAVEIYQLLDKAAQLQAQHPSRSILPVLVCRHAHYNTTLMARDLGFIVMETIVQPIVPHPDLDGGPLDEVRTELGYDLVQTEQPLPVLVDAFKDFTPSYADYYARQWARTAPTLAPYYRRLRSKSLSFRAREATFNDLKSVVATLPGIKGGWLPATEP